MKPSSTSSILLATAWIIFLSTIVRLTGTLSQTTSPSVDKRLPASSSVVTVESQHRRHDLLCVCGKGGTCIDRTVDFTKLPRGSDECFCNISKGFYADCNRIVNHCETTVCLNGGTCYRTFGGFYCSCVDGFMGAVCADIDNGVEEWKSAKFQMTFNFIHTTTNDSKKLYLAVQSFGGQLAAVVDFNDGREDLVLKEKDFQKSVYLNKLCKAEYEKYPQVHDKRVCQLFEEIFSISPKPFFVAIVEPNYPLRTYRTSDPGRIDNITVSFFNGGHRTLYQVINFFTPFYGVHNYVNVNRCRYQISFRGCGLYYNGQRNYRVSDKFIVVAITVPIRPCKPIRKRIGFWRYYPNDSNAYIDRTDKELTFRTEFERFSFKPGRRWIEYHLKEIGDDMLYDQSHEFESTGRCSIDITKGTGELFILGGTQRTYPCLTLLTLELATTNPGIDLSVFSVEWDCMPNDLSVCRKQISHGNSITYEGGDFTCGATFIFRARLLSDDIVDVRANQTIDLVDGVPEFYIKCIHNCMEEFQSEEFIRLSYVISIVADKTPDWEIFVDDRPVSVKNRTDSSGIFIEPPLDYLFSEPNSSNILEVVATIGNIRSEIRLKKAVIYYAEKCESQPEEIDRFEPFNVLCTMESSEFLHRLVLIEETEDWTLFGEPIAETDQSWFFNVQISSATLCILVYDSDWYQPKKIYPGGDTFKIPVISENDINVTAAIKTAIKEVDEHFLSRNYVDSVSSISRLFLLLKENNLEDDTIIEGDDILRLQIAKKLARMPVPATMLAVFKQIFTIFRISQLKESEVQKKSCRHMIARFMSKILHGTMTGFTNIVIATPQKHWAEALDDVFLKAMFDLSVKLLMLPYTEFQYRINRMDLDFTYFMFETRAAGDTLLDLLDLTRDTILPLWLYEPPTNYTFPTFATFSQTDSLGEINQRVSRSNNYILSEESSEGALNKFYYYNSMAMSAKSFWWIGNVDHAHNIVSPVISASYVDYETEERVNLPISTVHFTIDAIQDEKFWVGAGTRLSGVSKNAPDDDTQVLKDRSIVVWQFQLPVPSTGMFFMFKTPRRMKVYIREGQFPSYQNVFDSPVQESEVHGFNFNMTSSIDSNSVYVAVLPEDYSPGASVSYEIFPTALICLNYLHKDWIRGGCKLRRIIRENGIVECSCSDVSWHAVEKVVMNARSVFSDSEYSMPPKIVNLNVFVNLIAFVIFFIALFAFAYWKDNKDVKPNVFHFIEAPQVFYKFPYLVDVHTGSRIGSGTDSSVGFRIIGRKAHYGPHLFRYRTTRGRLSSSGENWFLIETQTHLGQLYGIDVWNDYSGVFLDWYCEKIIVYDLTLMEANEFVVERWLTQIDFSDCVNLATRYNDQFEDVKKPSVVPRSVSARSDQISRVDRHQESEKSAVECKELRRYIVNQIGETHHWISFFFKNKRNIYSHKDHAIILMQFVATCMGISMELRKFAGAIIDAAQADFTVYEAVTSAVVLAVTYILFAIGIFLYEKSCDPKKKFKPVNSKNFQYESWSAKAPRRRGRQRTFHSRSMSEKLARPTIWARKNVTSHLFSPSSYYPWLDLTNIRKGSRPKIRGWELAWKVFTFCCIAVSLAFVFVSAFTIRQVDSEHWMIIYGVALLADAIIVDPLRITIKSICLFYFSHRKIWDLFYIQGVCESKIEEKDRLNYFMELDRGLLKRTKRDQRIHKIKIIFRTVVSSKWYAVACAVMLIFLFAKIRLNSDTKTQYYRKKNLEDVIKEPLVPGHIGLADVRNASEFTDYLTFSLLPNLHHYFWYNGQPLPLAHESLDDRSRSNPSDPWAAGEYRRGYIADLASKIVGAPIIRQLRVKPLRSWDSYFTKFLNSSGGALNAFTIETGDFSRSWAKYIGFGPKQGTWTYTYDYGPDSVLWNLIHQRVDGYIHKLPNTLGPSQRNITDLYLYNWFDNKTRLVHLQFVIFNVPTRIITSLELIVTVSPQCFYRGKFNILTMDAYAKSYAPFHLSMVLSFCLAFLGSLRIWMILSARGLNNYSHESNLSTDVLLVVACFLIIVYISLRILRGNMADFYIIRSFPDEYIRAFEIYGIDWMCYLSAFIVTASLFLISLPTFHGYARSEFIQNVSFEGVSSVSLVTFLMFAYFYEIVQGVLFLVILPESIDLFARAVVRDYSDFLDKFGTRNDFHLRWLGFMFIFVRLFNMAPFLWAYGTIRVKPKPIIQTSARGEQNALPSMAKQLEDMKKMAATERAAPRRTTWRWISPTI